MSIGPPEAAPKLVYLTTIAESAKVFLRGQLAYMARAGFEVHVVSSPGPELAWIEEHEGVPVHASPMEREIRPWADLKSLSRLVRYFRRARPTIVNAGTTKGGLLGMIAARIAGVPLRIYTVHGLRLETTLGWKRRVLELTERIASSCAHRVICVSPSLAKAYVGRGLAPADKVSVMGHGTINGIQAQRFLPNDARRAEAERLRGQLSLPADAPVVGFVGRLVRDKGIADLYAAFLKVREQFPAARLLLVGNFESGDPLSPETVASLRADPAIIFTGLVLDPAPYYLLMNVFAFPSRREGFGLVALEAATAGIPVVACRATGVVDAVADGVTGTIVEPHDVPALADALVRYLRDPEFAVQHGSAGQQRVLREFTPERVWEQTLSCYESLLAERGLPLPAGAVVPAPLALPQKSGRGVAVR
jgi:glycosyltransferase involved in cell wall biosynthesis